MTTATIKKNIDTTIYLNGERSHGILFTKVRGLYVEGGGPETYKLLLPRIFKTMECSVEGLLARGKSPGILRDNFMYRHWNSSVDIM